MTTYTLGGKGSTYAALVTENNTVVPADSGTLGNCEYVLVSNPVDLRAYAITTSDTVECLKIPAKTHVHSAWLSVDVVDATATSVHVGSGVDANGFLLGASLATLGVVCTPLGDQSGLRSMTGATGKGWFFSAADTLDLTFTTMTTTTATRGAKVRVYARCFTPRAV